ncbi:MAG: Gldg family protein [Clostridia bacterium]|nr:Gldg family protein [Clostridia bacterium]
MKIGNGWRRKLFRGSASAGITAIVIAAVLILNIFVTALCSGNLWYHDLTPEAYYNVYGDRTQQKPAQLYTLMDETVDYLDYIIDEANARREGDEPVKVDIIFCAAPDILKQTDMMRFVYYTALSLQKEFPETISVSWRDVWSNPSSVDEYRSTSYANIYQTNVIVASGTEYRVSTLRSFYSYDSDTDMSVPVGYNGQKQFVKQILDVTGAESPICCLTVNHGEPFAELDLADRENWPEYKQFLNVIEGAGYEIRYLDLEKDEIPENCRLILTFDPQTDFVSPYTDASIETSETRKLDAYLDQAYSYMVFLDADTPHLPNLEEYLEFWGISFSRYSGKDADGNRVEGSYQVLDAANRLDSTGDFFIAQYAKGKGVGSAVMSDIVTSSAPPKIVFGNAMPISYADTYENNYVMADESAGTEAYSYGYYDRGGTIRAIFDMFQAGTSDSRAEIYATANGERVTDANGNPIAGSGIYQVMTLSTESRTVGEGEGYTTIDQTSYVCAVGSTDFATDALLGTTSYGNTDALLSVLRYIGKEVNPVGLNFITLYTSEMDLVVSDSSGNEYSLFTEAEFTNATVVMAAVPAILMLGAGLIVLVRRRVRH